MQITTPLENQDASKRTPALRRAIGDVPGATTYLSGFPAINHDTQPIYNDDLARARRSRCPIALLVMVFMFGTLGGIAVPFVFAAMTIPTTLGFVWIFAHVMDMAIYVTNIVTLIGLAIAIDYSMLVVFRFREELAHTDDAHEALRTTMATAGRATLFSGATVAVGLALLVFMPLPFMRSMGVGGLLVPLVSIAASATLLPALLAVMGRGVNRFRVIPRRMLERRARARRHRRVAPARGARSCAARACGSARRRRCCVALALPATGLHLTGGDNRGVPLTTESTRGLARARDDARPGRARAAPDRRRHPPRRRRVRSGGRRGRSAGSWPSSRATRRCSRTHDPRAGGRAPRREARQANLSTRRAQVLQIRAAGRSDSGEQPAVDLVRPHPRPLRPGGALPGLGRRAAHGRPGLRRRLHRQGLRRLPVARPRGARRSPTCSCCGRSARSSCRPRRCVMNLLSVSATYGVLVLAFQHGWGEPLGLESSPQIEAWIPIFLFAMLFGLSMDYEVFLLSRMREEWDATTTTSTRSPTASSTPAASSPRPRSS